MPDRRWQIAHPQHVDALRRRRPRAAVSLLVATSVAIAGSGPLTACQTGAEKRQTEDWVEPAETKPAPPDTDSDSDSDTD